MSEREVVWCDGSPVVSEPAERWHKQWDGTWKSEVTNQVIQCSTMAEALRLTGQSPAVAYEDNWCFLPG